ncbi:35449_t:CDS:2, partial [Racocetra persica]
DLYIDTINNNFIEDIVDEPQTILKTILSTLENSPSLTAIESSADTTNEINLALQSSRNFQSTNYQASVQQIASQRNRFGVAFSTAKTAINIALETKSDNNISNDNNSKEIESSEIQNKDSINTLQKYLIDQTNDLHVTKIR